MNKTILKWCAAFIFAVLLWVGSKAIFASFEPVSTRTYIEINGQSFGQLKEDISNSSFDDTQIIKVHKYSDRNGSLFNWAEKTSKKSALAESEIKLISKDKYGRVHKETTFKQCKPIKWNLTKDKSSLYSESLEFAFQIKEN